MTPHMISILKIVLCLDISLQDPGIEKIDSVVNNFFKKSTENF